MHETHGMPLDILLDIVREHNMVVDWCGFLDSAIKVNWNLPNLFNKLEPLLTSVYGEEYTDQIILRLKVYYMETYRE